MGILTVLIIVCGVGTFLMRWLPIKYSFRGKYPFIDKVSEYIAPSAIAALFIAMIWPWINIDSSLTSLIAPVGGLLATAISYKLIGVFSC
jgi:branched-subunit amino acid transport protein